MNAASMNYAAFVSTRRGVVALLILMLAGCASGPRFNPEALPVLQTGQGRVVLLRGHTLQGGGTYPQVRINGSVVGNLVLGGYAVVNVPPGITEVVLEPGGFAWSAAYGVVKYSYTVNDTETIYLRLQMATGTSGVVMGGRALPAAGFDFKQINEKLASGMLSGLRAITP